MRLGVAVRLGLALFVLVCASLAIVYAAVVPSLDSRLVDSKVDARAEPGGHSRATSYRAGPAPRRSSRGHFPRIASPC